jgi:hypothetical protein
VSLLFNGSKSLDPRLRGDDDTLHVGATAALPVSPDPIKTAHVTLRLLVIPATAKRTAQPVKREEVFNSRGLVIQCLCFPKA